MLMELKKYPLEGEYPKNTAKHHPEKEILEFLHDGKLISTGKKK